MHVVDREYFRLLKVEKYDISSKKEGALVKIQISEDTTSGAMSLKDISTNLLKTDRLVEASKERNPMKEIGDPNKIAKTIDFLLDAHNNWMTGQIIHVDGGMNNLK